MPKLEEKPKAKPILRAPRIAAAAAHVEGKVKGWYSGPNLTNKKKMNTFRRKPEENGPSRATTAPTSGAEAPLETSNRVAGSSAPRDPGAEPQPPTNSSEPAVKAASSIKPDTASAKISGSPEKVHASAKSQVPEQPEIETNSVSSSPKASMKSGDVAKGSGDPSAPCTGNDAFVHGDDLGLETQPPDPQIGDVNLDTIAPERNLFPTDDLNLETQPPFASMSTKDDIELETQAPLRDTNVENDIQPQTSTPVVPSIPSPSQEEGGPSHRKKRPARKSVAPELRPPVDGSSDSDNELPSDKESDPGPTVSQLHPDHKDASKSTQASVTTSSMAGRSEYVYDNSSGFPRKKVARKQARASASGSTDKPKTPSGTPTAFMRASKVPVSSEKKAGKRKQNTSSTASPTKKPVGSAKESTRKRSFTGDPDRPSKKQKRGQSEPIWVGVPDEPLEGGWPDGWTKKIFQRASGASKGQTDRYWYTPKKQYKLRSMVEIRRYLDHLKKFSGDEEEAFSALKGKKKR